MENEKNKSNELAASLGKQASSELGEASLQREVRKPSGENKNKPDEIGGQKGPEPTRYGDWENKGRISDF